MQATIEGSRGVLESPLPRVYDVPEGGGGGGATSEPVTPAGGHGFNGSTMVQVGLGGHESVLGGGARLRAG